MINFTDFSSSFVVVLVQLEVLPAADEDLVGEQEGGGVDDGGDVDATEQLQAENFRNQCFEQSTTTSVAYSHKNSLD